MCGCHVYTHKILFHYLCKAFMYKRITTGLVLTPNSKAANKYVKGKMGRQYTKQYKMEQGSAEQ